MRLKATLTKTCRVAARRIGAIRREKVEWLWPGWLALGVLTLIDGDPEVHTRGGVGGPSQPGSALGAGDQRWLWWSGWWKCRPPEARILRNGLPSKAAKGGDALAALAALVGQALPTKDGVQP
jgi:hypothetical protein